MISELNPSFWQHKSFTPSLPPVAPTFHIKVVGGFFVTVLPYLPPVPDDMVWMFREHRQMISYEGPDISNSMVDYTQTKADLTS